MSISELYYNLKAQAEAPASQVAIAGTEERLRGKFPRTLCDWFMTADGMKADVFGIKGRNDEWMWQFRSLKDVQTVSECFPSWHEISLSSDPRSPTTRICAPSEYAIFCDQLLWLPFYAVNIREESEYFGEVIAAHEGKEPTAFLVSPTFDGFADRLYSNYHKFCLD